MTVMDISKQDTKDVSDTIDVVGENGEEDSIINQKQVTNNKPLLTEISFDFNESKEEGDPARIQKQATIHQLPIGEVHFDTNGTNEEEDPVMNQKPPVKGIPLDANGTNRTHEEIDPIPCQKQATIHKPLVKEIPSSESDLIVKTVKRLFKEKLQHFEKSTHSDLMHQLKRVEEENVNLRKREKILEQRITQLEANRKRKSEDTLVDMYSEKPSKLPCRMTDSVQESIVISPIGSASKTTLTPTTIYETLSRTIHSPIVPASRPLKITSNTSISINKSKTNNNATLPTVSSENVDFVPGLFRSAPVMEVKPYKKVDQESVSISPAFYKSGEQLYVSANEKDRLSNQFSDTRPALPALLLREPQQISPRFHQIQQGLRITGPHLQQNLSVPQQITLTPQQTPQIMPNVIQDINPSFQAGRIQHQVRPLRHEVVQMQQPAMAPQYRFSRNPQLPPPIQTLMPPDFHQAQSSVRQNRPVIREPNLNPNNRQDFPGPQQFPSPNIPQIPPERYQLVARNVPPETPPVLIQNIRQVRPPSSTVVLNDNGTLVTLSQIPDQPGQFQIMQSNNAPQRPQLIQNQGHNGIPQNMMIIEQPRFPQNVRFVRGPLNANEAMELSFKQQKLRFRHMSPKSMEQQMHFIRAQEDLMKQHAHRVEKDRMDALMSKRNKDKQQNVILVEDNPITTNTTTLTSIKTTTKGKKNNTIATNLSYPEPVLMKQSINTKNYQDPENSLKPPPVLISHKQVYDINNARLMEVPSPQPANIQNLQTEQQQIQKVSPQKTLQIVPPPPPPAYEDTLRFPNILATITSDSSNIILRWNCTEYSKVFLTNVACYLLFAYHTESLDNEPPEDISQWKKIGEVKALPLPIACSLTKSFDGKIYFFCIVPVHKSGQHGEKSNSCALKVTL